ncbi:MAG: hypothetical protein ACKVJG_25830 [Candidatus Latescibacterota bacterium]|jgi:hypothetical protein|tara:strand:+ start:502 stop:894 length:393 start_codon:yes stop_codon:yes gene_type:complete
MSQEKSDALQIQGDRVVLVDWSGDLSVDAEVVRAFDFACFSDGILLSAVKAAVLEQVAAQLGQRAVEVDVSQQIKQEIHEEIAALERASARGCLEDLFLEIDAVGESELVRSEAAADMSAQTDAEVVGHA